MGLCLEVLVATVGGDKFNDCARILGAIFEHNMLQQAWTMTQDQKSDKFIDKRLSDLDFCEIENDLSAYRKDLFGLSSDRHRQHARARQAITGLGAER